MFYHQMEKMMRRSILLMLVSLAVSGAVSQMVEAQGNPDRGQRIFSACAACHSLEPNRRHDRTKSGRPLEPQSWKLDELSAILVGTQVF